MISKSICLLPSEKKHYWAEAGNADFRKKAVMASRSGKSFIPS
jgi:hypothetical protein